MSSVAATRIFRFAPSPNGYLHLGHAYSALLNFDLANKAGGIFLLRIEDIDTTRCRPAFEQAIYDDLEWLGLNWPQPLLRQSDRTGQYHAALAHLNKQNLLFPCFCTRADVKNTAPDPNGAPLYPGTCKHLSAAGREARIKSGAPHALRLDMESALENLPPLFWYEHGRGQIRATPEIWGDVVLARKDIGTSYHLAVTVDDAAQNISDVVRGTDLFTATHVHRLLQHLMQLPTPAYRHHPLILDDTGDKLAKSQLAKPLRQWRAEGVAPADIRARIGLTFS